MNIETFTDWKLINSCCCQMPDGATITVAYDGISASFSVNVATYQDGVGYLTATTKYTYTDPDGVDYTDVEFTENRRGWNMDLATCAETDIEVLPDGSAPPEGSVIHSTEVVSWSDEWSEITFRSDIRARFDEITFPTPCENFHSSSSAYSGSPFWQIDKCRYRFQISSTWAPSGSGYIPWKGVYAKITYDILTEPDSGAPTLERDLTVIWTGPGSGAADDESWFTEWNLMDAPTVEGSKRIVNIRYEVYRSTRMGMKPQTTGDGYELP